MAIKSANAPSGQSLDDIMLEPYQRDFSGNIEGLRLTVSSRINANTDLTKIGKTHGNSAVEVGDLLVNERIIDRQIQTHLNCVTNNPMKSKLRANFETQ